MAEPERSSLNRKGFGGALPLLGVLQLEGCVVIADAPHRHRDIAKAINIRNKTSNSFRDVIKGYKADTDVDIEVSAHRAHRHVRGVSISPLKKLLMSGSTSPTVNSLLFQFVKH
jgi:hypothetical protein